ncbi:hypothetical protein [Alicyclobacillus sp. SO9]|uniref:hypothetical protein n=1 Tax=Alicyclobacillus sp. SO9 TaxID=2665646 RepID=UPI0018E779D6|nr:hypothetical protein [Alicyclobacillus sp. SO9]QQE78743.1 hypothetical protein GI364_23320 [Alicyclobacillus sp. SO9]
MEGSDGYGNPNQKGRRKPDEVNSDEMNSDEVNPVQRGNRLHLREASRMTVYTPPRGVPLFLHTHGMPPAEDWVPHIIGCEPVYLAGYGNAALITLDNAAQKVFGRGVSWIQREIHRYHGIDETEIRRKFQRYVNMYQSVPVIVPRRDLVLFAVKTRIPQHHNDGATGFVANTAVQTIEFISHKKSRIQLETGQHMDVLMSADAVRKRKSTAELFAFMLHRDGIM